MVLSQTKHQERKDTEVDFLLWHLSENDLHFVVTHMPYAAYFFMFYLFSQVLAEAKRITESRIAARVSFELDTLTCFLLSNFQREFNLKLQILSLIAREMFYCVKEEGARSTIKTKLKFLESKSFSGLEFVTDTSNLAIMAGFGISWGFFFIRTFERVRTVFSACSVF